jgi:hypothetical protein
LVIGFSWCVGAVVLFLVRRGLLSEVFCFGLDCCLLIGPFGLALGLCWDSIVGFLLLVAVSWRFGLVFFMHFWPGLFTTKTGLGAVADCSS